MTTIADLRAQIRADRFWAHEYLFRHRHEYQFAPFHRDLVADFWSDERFYIDLGFRECGKTTLVEEAVAMAACEGDFRNIVIVGAKVDLAAELLTNVKTELETNDTLLGLYGDQRGATWQITKIELKDGRCIQAVGRDQSLRGTKHRDWRPDLVVINDFEDDEEVLTPDGRRKTLRWVLRVLLPACDRRRRKIRIYDTVRDADSVPMQLHRHGWPARFIPVSYRDEVDGRERSSWPGHPTLTEGWIESERHQYARLGELDIWEREMMCNAATQADRTFTPEMIKVEPIPRTWQAVYAMVDPARTTRGSKSAYTGWAAWSWVRNRLIVWECARRQLLPDEIVDLIFRLARDYAPVEIGAEKQGLDQWLDQPVRQRMLKEGVIPYRGVRAVEQMGLIRALQAFASSGEMTLAQECPDLREEMLSFPTGRRDALNALAYAPEIKPGRLIYENWNPNAHIEPGGEIAWASPAYLACNATRSSVGAALVQCREGRTTIFQDAVSEGGPGESLERIVREASIAAGGARLTLIAGRKHWEQYQNVGLVQAARSLGLEVRPGGDPARGRELIRRELGRSVPAGQAFAVAPAARWVLNAFAGGYSVPLRDGSLANEPSDNNYRLIMEGLEAFAGLMAFGLEDEDEEPNWAYDGHGRRYRSALPVRMQMRQ